MDYTTLPSKKPLATGEENLEMVFSLYEALQELPDARRAQGKRYSLALILCLVILAKLAGQKSLSGATQWLHNRRVALTKRFGLRRPRLPCHMTYCNVLAKVDGVQLDTILLFFSALGSAKPMWRGTKSVVDSTGPRRSFASGD